MCVWISVGHISKRGNSGSFERDCLSRNCFVSAPSLSTCEGSYGILGLEGASRNIYLARILIHFKTSGVFAEGREKLGGALGLSAFNQNSPPFISLIDGVGMPHNILRMSSVV